MTSFDFGKVGKARSVQSDPDYSNPAVFFYKLSHPSIRDLYPVQRDILKDWYESFKEGQNDKMISLNTGGGKTLIGLMIADSIRREKTGKVLYVCPNNFLGKQALDECLKCGIKSSSYLDSGTWTNKESFLENSVICVTNYDSVFNSRSIFNEYEIAGVIFDDAHLSLDLLDKQYSLKIDNIKLINEILEVFKTSPVIKEKISSIKDGDPLAIAMIPPLEWHQNATVIRGLLAKSKEICESLSWINLKELMDKTFCFISSKKIEISLLYPNIKNHFIFKTDMQRVFLSATLPNLDDLTRVFGITPTRIENSNPDYRPQRLFVFANKTSIENKNESIRKNLNKISAKCLVITPSSEKARQYESIGARVAAKSSDVVAVIDKFKKDEIGIIALANRYDGIDLPGDACHCLVLDGLPFAGTLKTKFFSEYFHNHHNSFLRSIVASKLIQAFGRTVRGNDDFSIILLLGDKLNSWIINRDNRKFFKKDLLDDVEIGINVSASINNIEDLQQLSSEILNQTDEWKEFLNDRKASSDALNVITHEDEEKSIQLSKKERRINDLFFDGKYKECLSLILDSQKEIAEYSKPILGLYLGIASICCFELKDYRLTQLSARAYGINPIFGIPASSTDNKISLQAQRILDYDKGLPVLDWTQKEKIFDENMKLLGDVLGFSSYRPENDGDGTLDVCWVDEERKCVIGFENKVNKTNNILSKKEVDQCSGHNNWLKKNYPGYIILLYAVGEIDGCNELASPGELMHTDVASILSISNKLTQVYSQRIYPNQIDPFLDENSLRIDNLFVGKKVVDLPSVK